MGKMIEYTCQCGKKFLHRPPDGTWGGHATCEECWQKARDEGRVGVGTAWAR
jgi:hypothetical protein